MTKKILKNTEKNDEELDCIESEEAVLAWPDDEDESDDGTIHAWQLYSEEEEIELAGDLPQRQRNRPDKDSEADLVWELYWNKHNNFLKVANELGFELSTTKNKFRRAFERKTGFPHNSVNIKRYRRLRQREIYPPTTTIPCAGCPRLKPKCSENCAKLKKLLPDFTEPRGLPLDPEDVSDMFDSPLCQPKRPPRPYDQEDEED